MGHILIDTFISAIKPHLDFDSVEVVLDIGSRDLEQSKELHSVFPNAIIHAFEPNPESYEKCRAEAPDYVMVWPYAILDYDGQTTFYSVVQKDNHGASSVFEPTDDVVGVDRIEGLNRIVVPCRRIDSWADENGVDKIDLCWVDCQGAELQVFQSFGRLIDGVKALATEVETGALYYPNRKYQPTQYGQLKLWMEEHGFTEVSYLQPWPMEADVCYARVS